MRLDWSTGKGCPPTQGFEDAHEHVSDEYPNGICWPGKLIDADGQECLVSADQITNPALKTPQARRPNGMYLVPALRVDTLTGEVWWRVGSDEAGNLLESSQVFKAPLRVVSMDYACDTPQ